MLDEQEWIKRKEDSHVWPFDQILVGPRYFHHLLGQLFLVLSTNQYQSTALPTKSTCILVLKVL